MQLISNLSKFLILAVLSVSLLINWNSGNIEYQILSSMPRFEDNPIVKTVTATRSDTVWEGISREFKLDHKAESERVQREIRRLLADQSELHRILQSASPFIYFMFQQTKARGLPAELALIPIIESEFNPYDKSKKGAVGLWQLMPQTARELGVKIKSGYDGRRNTVASTKAALAYFKDLGKYFNGDWYLAIAAYNCGQGKVDRVKKRAGSDNFWKLPLPAETKYYVPRLLAVAEIVKNPKKYGVALPQVTNEPFFMEVKVNKPVNLEQVAKSTGVSVKTVQKLNADVKQEATPKKGNGTVLIPIRKETTVKTI